MHRPLILNSAPLIYLTKVSLAHLFRELREQKFTTPKVLYEAVDKGKGRGAPEASLLEGLFKEKTIQVCEPKDTKFVKNLIKVAAEIERQPLHEAEAEVLAIAKEMDGVAISDDRVARSVAQLFGIKLRGTGYILGKMYQTGKIDKEKLIQKIKEMREQGWYVSAENYLNIIKYLEEL